jgi:ribosomal protein S18 acetylase RimI-like enzyme
MAETPHVAFIRALELHSARAWPAPEIVRLNGWELRFTPGSRSRRVNSLTAVAPEPGRFGDTLRLARRLCRERGLPCTVRLTPLAGREPAAMLADMGFPETGEPTAVMVAPVPRLDAPETVSVAAEVGGAWLMGLSASGVSDAERDLIARLVGHVDMPQAFACVLADGAVASVGRAACSGGFVGLFNIATDSSLRRHGYGRQVVTALLAWARRHNAMRAYLQVGTANDAAVALYRTIGFNEAYRYDYVNIPQELS